MGEKTRYVLHENNGRLLDDWKFLPENAQENADYLKAAKTLGASGFMLDISDSVKLETNFLRPFYVYFSLST